MVLEMPALEIGAPSSWAFLDGAIARLSEFDWLVLTSTNGVDAMVERLSHQGKTVADLAQMRIAVVGRKTAQRLRDQGREPDFIPPDFVADSLIEHFPEGDRLSGLRILFPRVESGGREVLVKEFTTQGAIVTEVPAYESGCAKAIAPSVASALCAGQVHIITFASSKTVKCFAQLVQTLPTGLDVLNAVACLASIGPQTSDACRQYLGRVDVEAQEFTLEGLTAAIAHWVTSRPSLNS
jgi:uroporphyrinogen-III synthase